MELQDLQNRIIKIEKKIYDDHSGLMGAFNSTPLAGLEKDKLFAELRMLERQEQFLSNREQTEISSKIGFGSVGVGLLAVFASIIIAFAVPYYQRIVEERNQIESIYKNLITNQDIFVVNSNESRSLLRGNIISNLPESYIKDEVSEDAGKTLQNTFGLAQYRFFIYYQQQTALLNEEIDHMREGFVATKSGTINKLSPTSAYLASMEYLSLEGKDTKFNYMKDTECLQYFFERNFSYLTIDGRGRAPECSSDTLGSRLFNHFGYYPADTPKWLQPLLRRALNEREPALGDKLIEI